MAKKVKRIEVLGAKCSAGNKNFIYLALNGVPTILVSLSTLTWIVNNDERTPVAEIRRKRGAIEGKLGVSKVKIIGKDDHINCLMLNIGIGTPHSVNIDATE